MKKSFLDWELDGHGPLSWSTLGFYMRGESGNWKNRNDFPFSEELLGKDWDDKWGDPLVCGEMVREFNALASAFRHNLKLRRYLDNYLGI